MNAVFALNANEHLFSPHKLYIWRLALAHILFIKNNVFLFAYTFKLCIHYNTLRVARGLKGTAATSRLHSLQVFNSGLYGVPILGLYFSLLPNVPRIGSKVHHAKTIPWASLFFLLSYWLCAFFLLLHLLRVALISLYMKSLQLDSGVYLKNACWFVKSL